MTIEPFHVMFSGREMSDFPIFEKWKSALSEMIEKVPFKPSTIIFALEDIPYPLFSILGRFFVEYPLLAKSKASAELLNLSMYFWALM